MLFVHTSKPSETVFNFTKVEYEVDLKKSVYKANLKCTIKITSKSIKNRQRNVIWFNTPTPPPTPPSNNSLKTYVGNIFFRLLDKHFPRANKLYKIFNCDTVKVIYSCMKNIRQIIQKSINDVKKPQIETMKQLQKGTRLLNRC